MSPDEVIPDLDKIRDEKCVPVARGILNDMAVSMIPEDANEKIDYNPILKSILERTLEADMNVVTENPYVFQLILKAFAGLNKAVQECQTELVDDVRFGKISKEIVGILATTNFSLPEPKDEEFEPLKVRINELFARENLTIVEVKYVMDNIFDAFSAVQGLFTQNVAQSTESAEARMFGLESFSDLTMKKLDEVLRTHPKV